MAHKKLSTKKSYASDHLIPLDKTVLNEFQNQKDEDLLNNAFEVVVLGPTGRSFLFYARSSQEKEEWLQDLRPILDKFNMEQKRKHDEQKRGIISSFYFIPHSLLS